MLLSFTFPLWLRCWAFLHVFIGYFKNYLLNEFAHLLFGLLVLQ
jgi:hypothetical protein